MPKKNISYIHESLRSLAHPVSDLSPDPNNARRHNPRNQSALKRSMKRFGMRSALVGQKNQDGEIVVRVGNNRLAQAKELGWEYLPVIIVEEDDDVATAFALADNRTAELGSWDWDRLSVQLSEIEAIPDIDIRLDDLGWSDEEAGNIIGTIDFTEMPDGELDKVGEEPVDETAKLAITIFDPDQKDEVKAAIKKALDGMNIQIK